jgi:hypothetical protein
VESFPARLDWALRICYATGYMNQEDVRRSSVNGRCWDTDGGGELFGTVWDGRSSSLGVYKIVYKTMYRGIWHRNETRLGFE